MVDLEMKDSNPLSISIIQAISVRENKDPNDLDYTLNDHIDPDILDRLQSNGPRKWSLDFLLDSHHVSVNQDGRIIVDGKTVFD